MAFDPRATPGTSLEWQRRPEHWRDASTLGACLASYVFDNQLPLAGRLCGTRGAQDLQMRLLPWRPRCEHVLRHGSRAGAPALTTAAELRDYLQAWSAASKLVRHSLEWRYTPADMCNISRLGAWLGDVVNTELCVRARTHRSEQGRVDREAAEAPEADGGRRRRRGGRKHRTRRTWVPVVV